MYRIRQCKFVVPVHVYFHVLYYRSLSATNQEDKRALPSCLCAAEGTPPRFRNEGKLESHSVSMNPQTPSRTRIETNLQKMLEDKCFIYVLWPSAS